MTDKRIDKNSPWAKNASTLTALTDNTGGTASSTLAAITAGTTYAQADIVAIKNALASQAALINALIAERST